MNHRTPALVIAVALLAVTTVRCDKKSPSSAPPRTVEVIRPIRKTLTQWLNLPATVEPYEQAELVAKVSGYVSKVSADIGDYVTRGQVLAEISLPETVEELAEAKAQARTQDAMLKAAEAKADQASRLLDLAKSELRRFEADLKLKQATFRRSDELAKGKAITDQELDETRNQLEVAEAQVGIAEARVASSEADVHSAKAGHDVAVAQKNLAVAHQRRLEAILSYENIKAPFNGIVARRRVDRGDFVNAAGVAGGSALFTVQRVDPLRIRVEIPESDVAAIRVETRVTIRPFGMGGKGIASSVTRIAKSIEPSTRTMRVEIDLSHPNDALMPGMYAQVALAVGEHANVLAVPAGALFADGKQQVVNVVRDGKANRATVKTGIDDDGLMEIKEGLTDDAAVVAAPMPTLVPGTPVQVKTKTESH